MNKEFNGFDEMVEALEENEDMVECKECFDLFPKAECEKSEVGYVCPVCKGLRTAPAQTRFVDPYDCYTQEFPEVRDYNPDSVVEYEREPDLGDALDDLIKDEYEAIDGYEVADEKIQHAAIDADQKDEILDTLDHIKEEEEEHIDELKELCPECDSEEPEKLEEKLPREPQVYDDNGKLIKVKDPEILKIWGKVMDQAEADGVTSWDDYATQKQIIDKALTPEEIKKLKKVEFEDGSIRAAYESLTEDAEEEIEEIPEEDIPEEEAEDSEENENEEVSDLDSAYEAALEIANESGVGQVFGYARKDTEEFIAIEPFEVDDPEAVEDDLMAVYDDVAYAYVAYPEKNLEEALFESVQLNEGPGRFFKGLSQKIGNAAKHVANRDSGKLIDKFFNNGYIIIFEGPKDEMPEEHKEEFDTADQALTAALHYSKEYPKYKVWVFAKPIDESELTPREKNLAKAKSGLSAMIGCFRNGTALQKKDKEIADTLKKIEIDKQDLMKTTGKVAGEKRGDPRDSLGSDEEEGEKAAEDTAGEKPAEEAGEDKDPDLGDDEDPRDKVKQMLGEKKAPDGYTPESYKKYAAAYAKILAWIEAHKKPEALTQERIDNLKKEAEAKLVAAPDEDADPDLSDDEEEATGNNAEDTAALDEAKAKAKETLGEKKAAEGYTEDSYATYSENYDKVVAAIEGATSEEDLKKIVDQIPKLNAMLAPKEDDAAADDTAANETEETPEEESEKESPEDSGEDSEDEGDSSEDTETTSGTAGKLSEVSEDQLKKLFTAVTGRGVGDNKKWQKTMRRMRAKLQELGESLDPNDYQPEDFISEELQSEADAVKSLKDTAASLKSTAASMQNMTSAMREEYHRYANPAELAAMNKIEVMITNAMSQVYSNLAAWGYDAEEVDGQSWLCSNNEDCLQYMVHFKNLDPAEAEDLAEQLQNTLENTVKDYKCPAEIQGLDFSIALPDYDLVQEDDEAKGITRASFLFYVTFARNLY